MSGLSLVERIEAVFEDITSVDASQAWANERDAILADVRELERALKSARRAIGEHSAPNDCYATGPLTGDPYIDLVVCPACAFIADHDAILTKCAGRAKEPTT